MFYDSIPEAAAWLDKKVPDWAGKIDIDNLDMVSIDCCVLGQVFGGYVLAQNKYYIPGFTSAFGHKADRSAWIHEINQRKPLTKDSTCTTLHST